MGMTQSSLLKYSHPDRDRILDTLESQEVGEVFYILNIDARIESKSNLRALSVLIIEKAIVKPKLMEKFIDLIAKLRSDNFYSALGGVLREILEKIVECYEPRHLNEERVVLRGQNIATFTGKMVNIGVLRDDFMRRFLKSIEEKEDKQNLFFRQEIQKVINDFELDMSKLVSDLIKDETKLKNFVSESKAVDEATQEAFEVELRKVIKTHSARVLDVEEFSQLGRVLLELYKVDLIGASTIDPWFEIARKNDSTIAEFIIILSEAAEYLVSNINWTRVSGIIHVPVKAQHAMNALLKYRDRERRDLGGPFYLPDIIEYHKSLRTLKTTDKCPTFTCKSTIECDFGAVRSAQLFIAHINHKTLTFDNIRAMMLATSVMLNNSSKKRVKQISDIVTEESHKVERSPSCDTRFRNFSLVLGFLYKHDILESDVMNIWMKKLSETVMKREKTHWAAFMDVYIDVFEKVIADSMKAKDKRLYAFHSSTIERLKYDISFIFPEFEQLKEATRAYNRDIKPVLAIKVPNNPVAFRAVTEHLVDLALSGMDTRHVRYLSIEIIRHTVCKKTLFFEALCEYLFRKFQFVIRKRRSCQDLDPEAERLADFFHKLCQSRVLERPEIARVYKIIMNNARVNRKFGLAFIIMIFNSTWHFLPGKNPLPKEVTDILSEFDDFLCEMFKQMDAEDDAKLLISLSMASSDVERVLDMNARLEIMIKNNVKPLRVLYAIPGEYENTGYDEEADWYVEAE